MYIKSSAHAFEILKKRFMHARSEEFWVIALNHQLKKLGTRAIFKGTVNQCSVHPRDIFLYAIEKNSTQILIAHNHVSCSPWPSQEDLKLTKKLIEAGQLLQIPIIDHLIINGNEYTSFADNDWFRVSL